MIGHKSHESLPSQPNLKLKIHFREIVTFRDIFQAPLIHLPIPLRYQNIYKTIQFHLIFTSHKFNNLYFKIYLSKKIGVYLHIGIIVEMELYNVLSVHFYKV